jgi:hypothetical protein
MRIWARASRSTEALGPAGRRGSRPGRPWRRWPPTPRRAGGLVGQVDGASSNSPMAWLATTWAPGPRPAAAGSSSSARSSASTAVVRRRAVALVGRRRDGRPERSSGTGVRRPVSTSCSPRYDIGRTTEEKRGLREEPPPATTTQVRRVDERARHLSHGRRLFVGAHSRFQGGMRHCTGVSSHSCARRQRASDQRPDPCP